MTKSRYAIYAPIDEEMEAKKQYLASKGFCIAILVRNFIAELYEREKQKETSSVSFC